MFSVFILIIFAKNVISFQIVGKTARMNFNFWND